MAKLVFNPRMQRVPAGLITGIEAFWYNSEKWVIANGTTSRFVDAPPVIQQTIAKAFQQDAESIAYLSKMGLTRFTETFDRWYQCVVGGLDNVPDFENGTLKSDAYNNMCIDSNCPHRGKLCSRALALKNYEIETIVALKQGHNLEITASQLCISLPGMKSRVEKIKETLHVPNMAALMAYAAEIGI